MSRLVTFGCSYTYGQGLEDCFVPPNSAGPNPSAFAWPNLAAQKLNLECVNMSVSGYSNLAILNSILNFDFKDDDVVAVMWTFKTRDLEFKDQDHNVHYGRWVDGWLDKQNVYNLIMKGYIYMHHAHCYLNQKNVKFYFFDNDWYFTLENEKPKWLKEVQIVPFKFKQYEYFPPLGLDNLHPGPVFHNAVCDTLVKHINQNA